MHILCFKLGITFDTKITVVILHTFKDCTKQLHATVNHKSTIDVISIVVIDNTIELHSTIGTWSTVNLRSTVDLGSTVEGKFTVQSGSTVER